MPVYDRSTSTGMQVIDSWSGGVGWLAHPDEEGERASHAIDCADGVWVLDPVDAPGVDDLLDDLGDVVGVAVLSSYHARDAGAIAARHEVPVHVPRWMDRVDERVGTPVERYDRTLGDSGFRIHQFEPLSLYQEAVAYRADDGTLVVPDLLSSVPETRVGDERIGMVLPHRLAPPRETLGELDPERILFGHGEGVFEDASAALEDCLAGARRRLPRALATQLVPTVRMYLGAMSE